MEATRHATEGIVDVGAAVLALQPEAWRAADAPLGGALPALQSEQSQAGLGLPSGCHSRLRGPFLRC